MRGLVTAFLSIDFRIGYICDQDERTQRRPKGEGNSVSRTTRHTLILLTILLSVGSAKVSRYIGDAKGQYLSLQLSSETNIYGLPTSPCAEALSQHAVCDAANFRATEIMKARKLEAATVVQDVKTGALVLFAATEPAKLDVTNAVLPLSVSKLLLAASWWDHQEIITNREQSRVRGGNGAEKISVHEMLVTGRDQPGRQLAVALRKSIGTKRVLKDLRHFGFAGPSRSSRDESFWTEIAPEWRDRLAPAPVYASLEKLNDADWAEALSLGEANIVVTILHVSRFLQSIGNDGWMFSPVARSEQHSDKSSRISRRLPSDGRRIMSEQTARRLQSAMRDAVQRGTAKGIAAALRDTDWQMGGKTGSGPANARPPDGWFAGLVFDPQGKARFTVATFVRRGGPGGTNAAQVSAELAKYLIASMGSD